MSEDPRARRLLYALKQLERKYDVPEPPTSYTPLETFMAAVLMDQVHRERAYEAVGQLRKRFVDWNEARVSMGKEIADYCSPVNVPEASGRAIQRALEKIHADWNAMSLDPLESKSAKDVREYLSQFEGISSATIAYTMLYALRKSAIPVTPDVLRYAERLGVVEGGSAPDRAERLFERIIPSGRMATFFECFNRHGGTVCLKKTPKCRVCVTARICEFRVDSKPKPKAPAKAVKRAGKSAPKRPRPPSRHAVRKRSKPRKK